MRILEVIHQSGAIEQLTDAVREATIAARDTSKEISDTARELKERGVIRDTATAFNDSKKYKRNCTDREYLFRRGKTGSPADCNSNCKGIRNSKKGRVTDAAEKAKEPVRERAEKAKRGLILEERNRINKID